MAEGIPFIVAIVDHDAATRGNIAAHLAAAGYRVLEFESGTEARRLLREYPWDLLVVERALPDGDGAELCRELKAANTDFESRYVIVTLEESARTQYSHILDLGADGVASKPIAPEELVAKIRAGKRIIDLSKKLLTANKELARLSQTDDLTELYNRRHFLDQLLRMFDQSVRYQRPLSLAVIDIDDFKEVNDTWGHGAGDEVLRVVSERLAHSARSTDLVARYGGDEFAVAAPETNSEEALAFARRIVETVAGSPVSVGECAIQVHVSIGIASAPNDALETAMELIHTADKALYRAKAGGKNRVVAA